MKDEFVNFMLKICLPASIGISIKLAVQAKKQKISFCRILLAFITGVGASYLAYPIILESVGSNYVPLFLSVIAISSEKVAEYLIYKFNIDYFLTALIDAFRQALVNAINPKNESK